MNIHVLNLLNYVLIGFECIMASYLGAAFFRRRYHGVLHVLAVFALFLACIVYLKIFGQTIVPKLIIAVLVHMIWIKACFHTGTLKALFLSIFLVSFWFIFDTLCLIGLSALIQIDYRSLADSPFSYFLLCFGVKTFELLGLVVLCTLVDGLLNTELPKTRYINTNRPIADVLISQKAAIARNKHITLQLHLDDLSKFPLSDDELVVVLANLLDNAMTAAEKIPEEAKRRIFVRMECAPAVSYLYIENTTAAPVPIKSGRVVTRRSELSGHGFGIQNITTILDRRHGIYAFEYHPDENVFSFSAQLTETCE